MILRCRIFLSNDTAQKILEVLDLPWELDKDSLVRVLILWVQLFIAKWWYPYFKDWIDNWRIRKILDDFRKLDKRRLWETETDKIRIRKSFFDNMDELFNSRFEYQLWYKLWCTTDNEISSFRRIRAWKIWISKVLETRIVQLLESKL